MSPQLLRSWPVVDYPSQESQLPKNHAHDDACLRSRTQTHPSWHSHRYPRAHVRVRGPEDHELGRRLANAPDFARTVVLSGTANSDAFQKPVQWVLTTKESVAGAYMIILSPFEASLLLPIIKDSLHVMLHIYAPRINLSFPCLQDLKLYTAPALPAGWVVPYHLVQ